MDDGQWRRLADFAGIKPTNEPGTCVVSRAVKRIVYELAHVGAAVRYRQAHEDVMT